MIGYSMFFFELHGIKFMNNYKRQNRVKQHIEKSEIHKRHKAAMELYILNPL